MPRAVKLCLFPLSVDAAVRAMLQTVVPRKHPEALERAVARSEQRRVLARRRNLDLKQLPPPAGGQ